MRLTLPHAALGLAALGLAFALAGGYDATIAWALDAQRGLQNDLARLVGLARQGDPWVALGLVATAGLYGLVHAAGPGHGKFLLGGAALAQGGSPRGMAGLALASSLAQGLVAVVLVYGGLGLLSLGAKTAVDLTDQVLTPLSYAAVALIGAVLVWRGALALRAKPAPVHHHNHHHHDDCGCGHSHGPTAAQVAGALTWRDRAALVAGIALRPCTGAVMVLVIAWNFGLHALGLAAVLAMSLGTGLVTGGVALAALGLRGAGFLAAPGLRSLGPLLQLGAGALILALSLGLLRASL